MIAPLLVAFGLVRDVPWHFYPLTALLIGLFIILPGVFGSALAIAIGRHLDRKNFQILLLLLALVLLAFVAFWWKTNPVNDELLDKRTLEALDQLLAKTRDELPHAITCRVTEWEWPHIRVEIIVERDSQKAIVIGKGGEVLKAVGIAVNEELPEGTYLDLHVKVERHWQNREEMLNRLGY